MNLSFCFPPVEVFVHRLSLSFYRCIHPSIPSHSSSLRLSIPLCSLPDPPAASLLSSCAVIQGGSGTQSWQQRWDGGMGWRQLSDYVCFFHWGLIWLSLILWVHATVRTDVCVLVCGKRWSVLQPPCCGENNSGSNVKIPCGKMTVNILKGIWKETLLSRVSPHGCSQ